jgi:hypothetical protein
MQFNILREYNYKTRKKTSQREREVFMQHKIYLLDWWCIIEFITRSNNDAPCAFSKTELKRHQRIVLLLYTKFVFDYKLALGI